MKRIFLLTTGGTIASVKNDTGRFSSGILTGEQLLEICEIPSYIEVVVESMFQKPSFHLTLTDLIMLKNRVNELIKDETIDGIVITQGTDTLEEAAYFLDLTVDTKKPVVMTGSQRAPNEVGSDAFMNLKQAIIAAGDQQLIGAGVVVVFNERIFSAKYVKKEHASNIQGFHSFGYGYLGVIDNDRVYVYQKPVRQETYPFNDQKIPKVDVIKAYLDGDEKFLNCAISAQVDGIILEGAGRGQVPPNFTRSIDKAIKQGIKIVLTTSSEEGHTYLTYESEGSAYDLYRRGVILGGDLDSKKARMKLIVLLSSGLDIKNQFHI